MNQQAYLKIEQGDLILTSPYHRGLVEELKRIVPYHDRQWIQDRKVWRVKYMWGHDLAELVKKHLGQEIIVPKQITQAKTGPVTRLLKIEYIGSVRERDDNSQTATGFANGGWNVIFPFDVIRAWFNDEAKPDEAPTYYAVLGCKSNATPEEIKKSYRLAARTWHPDINKDPDAPGQFIRIKAAYDVLSDAQQRKKYDAGLIFERRHIESSKKRSEAIAHRYGWSPPIRCGWLTVVGQESLGRITVEKILSWNEITNEQNKTMVSYWPKNAEQFKVEWL